MSRVLLINTAEREEIRAALLADGRVEEFRKDRAAAATLVGNVYKGRVVNLETGIGAAFIDVGEGRNAFLHVSDCVGADPDTSRISDHCAVGDEILAQVTRDSIGSKGPVLTANVSLAGRFAVLLPYSDAGGISRRIEESEEKSILREVARELEQRVGLGLILRTASADRGSRELTRDVRQLVRLWEGIQAKAATAKAPAQLYAERDLVARSLRDMVDKGVEEIWVDTPGALARAQEAALAIQPELQDRLRLHDSPVPLFHAFEIESQIDQVHTRRVALPGGGSLVFDATEALVAVDVNSGRTRHEEGLEETALQTNLEAADEIARQLRLRDLGGVVVVDFIDMRDPAHVRRVDQVFRAHLRQDRVHLRPGRLGAFGIFLLTRQRAGGGASGRSRPCPRCLGTGQVVHPEETALRVWRDLLAQAACDGGEALRAVMGPEVADALRAMRKGALRALAEETGHELLIESDPSLPPDAWRVESA